jgi:hypothetical protein
VTVVDEQDRREEGGTIRRLGHFPGPVVHPSEMVASEPDPELPDADTKEGEAPAGGLNPAAFALILMLTGSLVVSVGVGLAYGFAFALITLGAAVFLVGFMTARDN